MMKQFLTILFAATCAVGNAQSAHDTMTPFGFATCTSKTACMNPRLKSETLIEGNYFDASLTNVYESKDATQVIWRSSNSIANTSVTYPITDDETPTDTLVPYPYTIIPTADVPSEVGNNAGATLFTKTAQ